MADFFLFLFPFPSLPPPFIVFNHYQVFKALLSQMTVALLLSSGFVCRVDE